VSSSDNEPSHQHTASSLWPIGFAIGIACALVGLVVSVPALIVGAALAVLFGFLWIRDIMLQGEPSAAVEESAPAEDEEHIPTYDRSALVLGASTLGLGAVIGAAVTVPSLGFAVLPSFTGEGIKTHDVDLGPISNFPEGSFVIATFMDNPEIGEVARRTAYIRNNGLTNDAATGKKVPSFTILFSRCVHLGCPVQPNGPILEDQKVEYKHVTLIPAQPAGFGCPCHGGQYDTEGNRIAGPPVRSLDRFSFSIVKGNLILGKPFSVGNVEGEGADAQISRYRKSYPGVHVDGLERWLYPIPVPGS
jgi:menaquinol-cytochrome c reductase iron-sulfur subunit